MFYPPNVFECRITVLSQERALTGFPYPAGSMQNGPPEGSKIVAVQVIGNDVVYLMYHPDVEAGTVFVPTFVPA